MIRVRFSTHDILHHASCALRCPEGAPAYRQAGTNHENSPGVLVRVVVTKPVSVRVEGLRELLKTKNVTE
jgi:hypothetical protein